MPHTLARQPGQVSEWTKCLECTHFALQHDEGPCSHPACGCSALKIQNGSCSDAP